MLKLLPFCTTQEYMGPKPCAQETVLLFYDHEEVILFLDLNRRSPIHHLFKMYLLFILTVYGGFGVLYALKKTMGDSFYSNIVSLVLLLIC